MTQPPVPLDGPDPADRRDILHDRRALALIGAGVVAVAALGLFVVKPLLSSSSSSGDGGVVAGAHHPTAKASVSPSVTPKPVVAATAAPALDVRDPFSPLVTPTPTSTATATPTPTPTPTVATSVPGQTVVVQEPGPTVTKTTAEYTLVLDTVSYSSTTSKSSVTVTLNGKTYTVKVGGAFPDAVNGPFGLYSLSSKGVATFAYGDNAFTLHQGESQTEN